MAAKGKKTPVVPMLEVPTAPVVPVPGVDPEGFYLIPRDLLMQYRMQDAECRATHLQLRAAAQEVEALMLQHPEVARALNTRAALAIEANQSKQVLSLTHAVLEKMFNVKITDMSIDHDTGRVHNLSEAGGLALRAPVVTEATSSTKRRTKTKTKTKTLL